VPRIKTRVCASADVCIIARCVARLIVPVHPLVLPRGEEEASWRVSKIDQKGDLRRSSSGIQIERDADGWTNGCTGAGARTHAAFLFVISLSLSVALSAAALGRK
jgi:hypothetical protein